MNREMNAQTREAMKLTVISSFRRGERSGITMMDRIMRDVESGQTTIVVNREVSIGKP